ncbi:toprim domain-containing protein [Hydrogenivirga sp.]
MVFKDFSDWVRRLRDLSLKYPVLVEGKNDLRALRRYGIRNVVPLSGKRFADIPDLIEPVSEGAILLYDLDPHGERINRKVKDLLSSQGFVVIEDFREYLREAGIIHIEELAEVRYGKDKNS